MATDAIAPQETAIPAPQTMSIEEALPMLALIVDGTDAELCDVYIQPIQAGLKLKPRTRYAAYKIAERHTEELAKHGIEVEPIPSLSDLIADPSNLKDPDILGWLKWLRENDELEFEITLKEAKIRGSMRKVLEKDLGKTSKPLGEPLGEVVEYSEDIMAEARGILEEGNAVQYIMDTYKALHVGDETAGKLTFCTQFTPHINNSKGLHPKGTGESGKGKSAMFDTVIHMMPEEWYLKTSLSSKALFYNPIRPGTVVYDDDYKQNDDLDTVMKKTTSRFHKMYNHMTVDRGKDGLKGRTVSIPEELVWMITSVDSDQDTQVLNRVVPLDVDDSPNTDRRVVNKLLIEAEEGVEELPESHEVLVCRAILRILKSKRYYVSIPFARRIYFRDASNRRNPSMFLDIIRALAFWNQHHREVDEKGRLVATEEDFNEAKRLYFGDKRGNSFKTKLTAKELELARQIAANGGRLTRQDAAQKMGVTVGRIDQLTYGKGRGNERRGGLVSKLKGFHVEKETETRRVEFEYGHTKTIQRVILVLDDAEGLDDSKDAVELNEKAVVETPGDTPKIPTKIPNPPIAVDT